MAMSWFIFFCLAISLVYTNGYNFPDTAKNPFVYLEEKNYFYENHTVVTEDGYELLLVRIPGNKSGPPILFVHGFIVQFFDFLLAGPEVAFGFKALEQGYDVFLLNCRGNRWSRNHKTLDPDKDVDEFWDFSWHEMGIYDVPTTVDYIINLTGYSNVSYVGYSQGTTSFLVMASSKPEYNDKINVAVLLAPVAFTENARNPTTVLFSHNVWLFEAIVKIFHIREYAAYNPYIANAFRKICAPTSVFLPICKFVLNNIIAGASTQTNDSLVSAYVTQNPAGASIKQNLHFVKNAHLRTFSLYDYGTENNIVKYGQPLPPVYNLSAVTTPVALFYGASDHFVPVADAERLAYNLPNVVANVLVPYKKTNHFDPIIGSRSQELFTDPALQLINNFSK